MQRIRVLLSAMKNFELIATASFGLEAVVKREIEALGCEITDSRDGRISFKGDERDIVRSNLWLRCADRVYVKLGEFEAQTFDQLFERTKALPWAEWIRGRAEGKRWYPFVSGAFAVIVYYLSVGLLMGSTYNPFIYFRF